MVSRGTAQRATAVPVLSGDGENGRWADWVGREPGLVGCAGEKRRGEKVGREVGWR
jgi:hypothetical protein